MREPLLNNCAYIRLLYNLLLLLLSNLKFRRKEGRFTKKQTISCYVGVWNTHGSGIEVSVGLVRI